MPDLSRVVGGYATLGAQHWDAVHQRLVFTANGALNALDPLTGQVTSVAIPGALTLTDFDISPDGRFAIVADMRSEPTSELYNSDRTNFFYRVWLDSGRIDTLTFTTPYNRPAVHDVVILADGNAMFPAVNLSYPSAFSLYLFDADAETPAFVTDGAVYGGASPNTSGAHRYAFFSDSLRVYDSAARSISAIGSGEEFYGHLAGPILEKSEINEGLGRIAIISRDGSLLVTDLSLRLVADLSFDFDLAPRGVRFTPDGKQLFVLNAQTNQVAVFDTHTWDQLGILKISTKGVEDPFPHDGSLEFSSDGRFLFVDSQTGVEVVDLTANHLLPGEGSLRMSPYKLFVPRTIGPAETVEHTSIGYYLMDLNDNGGTILTIQGTLNVKGTYKTVGTSVSWQDSDQQVLVDYTGRLSVRATGQFAFAVGHNVESFVGAGFVNRGVVDIASDDEALAVRSYAQYGFYGNSGKIEVQAKELATGFLLENLNEGAFINSGSIRVQDGGGSLGQSFGVHVGGVGAAFTNDIGGSIIVSHLAPGAQTNVAVSITPHTGYRTGTAYTNAGLILGDAALSFGHYGYDGYAAYSKTFENRATGVLRGDVYIYGNGIRLQNAGLIEGAVDMGDQAETYDGSRGRVTGMVSGGKGDDLIIGGAQFDNLQGNAGNDAISGGGGDDWVVGGKDNDLLKGDAGADIVYGNLGNDTCEGGAGADLVRGGQGDDVLSGDEGDDWLSGDRGADNITGGAGADIFHTSQEAGIDRVTDFSAVQGDRVQLDPGTTYTLRQDGANVVIDMGGENQMILMNTQLSALPAGWIFGA